jgi:tRNA pseudouridine13 synthase
LGEKDEATNARKKWEEDGNIEQALRTFPHWMHVERSLLEGFKRHGKDSHKEALNCVTRNMRLMYVHAWQSGVFNRMASERVERYTLDPQH